MEDVFELRLHLVLGTRQSPSAVENSPATESRVTTNFDGSTFRPASTVEDPAHSLAGNERTGAHLTLPALNTPSVEGAA